MSSLYYDVDDSYMRTYGMKTVSKVTLWKQRCHTLALEYAKLKHPDRPVVHQHKMARRYARLGLKELQSRIDNHYAALEKRASNPPKPRAKPKPQPVAQKEQPSILRRVLKYLLS